MSQMRRCDRRCHEAKGRRCKCICDGFFHGANAAGTVNRQSLADGLTTLEEHGFRKGEALYVDQIKLHGIEP